MKLVIDSNVIIHGRNTPSGSLFTVPGVEEELESRSSLDLQARDVEVREPSEESVETVNQKAGEINSPTSKVDQELVALARDLGAELVTDDRAAQNLALHLDIGFRGFLDDSIEEKRCWTRLCENCGSKADGDACGDCGSSSIRLRQDRCS